MNVYNTLMQLGFGRLKREVVRGQGQGMLKDLFLSLRMSIGSALSPIHWAMWARST